MSFCNIVVYKCILYDECVSVCWGESELGRASQVGVSVAVLCHNSAEICMAL